MNLLKLQIHYRDTSGAPSSLASDSSASSHDNLISVALRTEHSDDSEIISTSITNRCDQPVHLDRAHFLIATGFALSEPARFFKHGYQSWSASIPRTVGHLDNRYDQRNSIVRINHQSEARRPPEAPESATSEMFTIIEQSGGDRVLAGFLEAASCLTTVTVAQPDAILARALLDGVELKPGATRDLPPLYLRRSNAPAAALAAEWAAKLGDATHARTRAPFQRGWCSWYHYFHDITEDALMKNLEALASMRSHFPIDIVQLDDGYQAALGDWDQTNEKFPSGLHRIADRIRDAGFSAGIWTAPFLAARDSRLMRNHPEWFIQYEPNQPLRAGYNPNWTRDEDKFAYALDPSHPAFHDHLVALFQKLVHEFGYSYLKLDFLYAAAAEGIRHDSTITRGETLRRGLEAIRNGAGESAFILGCGCPLGAAIGIVDGMRIGPDVSPYWGAGGAGDPSTVHALDAIIARSFMHRRLWLNDPDCLMLRTQETKLTGDERDALASVIAGSGGMLLISDDMALLGEEESKHFRDALALATAMDQNSETEPILTIDLMDDSAIRGVMKSSQEKSLFVILNRGESEMDFDLAKLGPGPYFLRAPNATDQQVTGTLKLPPHSALILSQSK